MKHITVRESLYLPLQQPLLDSYNYSEERRAANCACYCASIFFVSNGVGSPRMILMFSVASTSD